MDSILILVSFECHVGATLTLYKFLIVQIRENKMAGTSERVDERTRRNT